MCGSDKLTEKEIGTSSAYSSIKNQNPYDENDPLNSYKRELLLSDQIFSNFTGNPFIDAGLWVLSRLADKKTPNLLIISDLSHAKQLIMTLYSQKGWSKNLYSIFTTNHLLLNPSVKNRKEKYKKFLDNLIDDIETNTLHKEETCIGCGRRATKTRITNTLIPLTGSGKYLNFFSYLTEGADYCSACIYAIQFSPIAMYVAGNMLLLHSKSEKVMRYWTRIPVNYIYKQRVNREYTGCYKTKVKNPINSLFQIICGLLTYKEEREEKWEKEMPSVQFYYFTNFGQDPKLEIYPFPNSVFRFLSLMTKHEKYNEWQKIVKFGYRVNWSKVEVDDDYINKQNTVYQRLLSNKSIIRWFFTIKGRRIYGNWNMLSIYLKEVRNMDKKRIEIIKKVGDKLAEYIKETNSINRLGKLERAESYKEFRNQLRLIIKERIKQGEKEVLYTLEEYIEDLFPDYKTWKETQDLLLFRIYEKNHNWLVKQERKEEELIERSNEK